jgi:hypothetical protein
VCGLKNLEIGKETDIYEHTFEFYAYFPTTTYTKISTEIFPPCCQQVFLDFIMQTRRAHDAPLGTSAALAFVTLDYIRAKNHAESQGHRCRVVYQIAFLTLYLFLNHLQPV